MCELLQPNKHYRREMLIGKEGILNHAGILRVMGRNTVFIGG